MTLPADLAAAIARAGVDPTLPERELEEAIRGGITDRRGDLDGWYVDASSLWRVGLLSPVRESLGGPTLAEALAWCLAWLMGTTGEMGSAAFA